jgi:type I restriction enzyme S subunit
VRPDPDAIELPAQWVWKKLKYVSQLGAGDAITADEITEEGPYPVYGGNGLRGYTSNFNRSGSVVLVGRQGALCGNVNYAYGDYWASEHAIVVDPQGKCVVGWLGELLRSMNLNQYSQSAAQPGIAVDNIASLELPVPPVEIQSKISSFLDSETAEIDTLTEAKQKLLGLLAEKRRTLVAEAVMRGLDRSAPLRPSGIDWLGEIPAHWDACHLKRVLAQLDYGTSESTNAEGAIAILRMGDIKDGELDFSKLAFLEKVDDGLLLQEGDLVFNRTNSLDQIGKVALFRGNVDFLVSFASYLVRLRCKGTVLPEYMNWVLNSSYALAWARAEAFPSIGQANLNPSRYGYLPIALPPINEQWEIVTYLAGSVSRLDSIRDATERSMGLLKERRSALIAAAVTGQIAISEAA